MNIAGQIDYTSSYADRIGTISSPARLRALPRLKNLFSSACVRGLKSAFRLQSGTCATLRGLKQVGVTPMYAFGAFELTLTLRSSQSLLV